MSEIEKSKIQVQIKVEYYLSDLKVLDLNSSVFSHGWNATYTTYNMSHIVCDIQYRVRKTADWLEWAGNSNLAYE